MYNNFIKDKIDSLPALPQTIIDIENLKISEDYDINDLYKIISKDPLIVANILKVANSAIYGFSWQINTLIKALRMLWFDMVSNIAIRRTELRRSLDSGSYSRRVSICYSDYICKILLSKTDS